MKQYQKGYGKHNRKVIVDGNECRVSLGKKQWAIISVCDLRVLESRGFYAHQRNDGQYVARSCQDGRLLHRLLLADDLEQFPEWEVDHINGNPLDNTRGNIRVCTTTQNNIANEQPNEITGRYGVMETRLGYYRIWDGKNWVELFDDLEEACIARDELMLEKYSTEYEPVLWSTLCFVNWNYPIDHQQIYPYEEWLEEQEKLAA